MSFISLVFDLLNSLEEVARVAGQLYPGILVVPEHLYEGYQVDDRPHSRPGGALNITDLNIIHI